MPEHVGVDLKRQRRFLTRSLNEPVEPIGSEGRASFAYEHECRRRLAPQLPERPELIASDRVARGLAIFHAADVQHGRSKIHLLPSEIAHLRRTKAMSIRNQDHRRVAMAVPIGSGRSHHHRDFCAS
jgi:hypothetical protein